MKCGIKSKCRNPGFHGQYWAFMELYVRSYFTRLTSPNVISNDREIEQLFCVRKEIQLLRPRTVGDDRELLGFNNMRFLISQS